MRRSAPRARGRRRHRLARGDERGRAGVATRAGWAEPEGTGAEICGHGLGLGLGLGHGARHRGGARRADSRAAAALRHAGRHVSSPRALHVFFSLSRHKPPPRSFSSSSLPPLPLLLPRDAALPPLAPSPPLLS